MIMAVAFARHGQNQKSVCCARGGTARASVEVMLLDLRFAIWREEIQKLSTLDLTCLMVVMVIFRSCSTLFSIVKLFLLALICYYSSSRRDIELVLFAKCVPFKYSSFVI